MKYRSTDFMISPRDGLRRTLKQKRLSKEKRKKEEDKSSLENEKIRVVGLRYCFLISDLIASLNYNVFLSR